MTSKSDIEKIFQEAAAELAKPNPLKELTSSIIGIERKHVYGAASANSRLKTIRELIEEARKKGGLC